MRVALAIGLMVIGTTASAEPVPLWSTLEQGDTPAVVVSKLTAMPDVKRAKLRGGKPERPDAVDVNLNGGGLEILGERYGVDLKFENRGLTGVYLGAQNTCANDVYFRYSSLMRVLHEKYPYPAFPEKPEIDENKFLDAKIQLLNGIQSRITSAVSNGDTVAIVDVVFGRIPAPSVYGPQAKFAWSLYRIQASACGGTGTETSALRISYISAARWVEYNAARHDDRDQEREAAKNKL